VVRLDWGLANQWFALFGIVHIAGEYETGNRLFATPASIRPTAGCPTPRDFVPWRFSDAGLRSACIVSTWPAQAPDDDQVSRISVAYSNYQFEPDCRRLLLQIEGSANRRMSTSLTFC